MTGELVLIVEDNDLNRKLFRDLLNFHGFRTLEAATALEGVALAASEQPDVVLMDIQLPDLDGAEALRRLRSNPGTASIPVVALTAFAMKDDRERFLALGFDGYVSKPISVHEFPDQIRSFCDSAKQAQP